MTSPRTRSILEGEGSGGVVLRFRSEGPSGVAVTIFQTPATGRFRLRVPAWPMSEGGLEAQGKLERREFVPGRVSAWTLVGTYPILVGETSQVLLSQR